MMVFFRLVVGLNCVDEGKSPDRGSSVEGAFAGSVPVWVLWMETCRFFFYEADDLGGGKCPGGSNM